MLTRLSNNMEYIETKEQFVVVLNRKVELGRLLNAVGHMAAGLVALNQDKIDSMRFQDYIDKDLGVHPSISDFGFIVLMADNSEKLRVLRNQLNEKGVKFTDFPSLMTEGTYKELHDNMSNASEKDLEYFGICFFMNKNESRELTKKFSLFK